MLPPVWTTATMGRFSFSCVSFGAGGSASAPKDRFASRSATVRNGVPKRSADIRKSNVLPPSVSVRSARISMVRSGWMPREASVNSTVCSAMTHTSGVCCMTAWTKVTSSLVPWQIIYRRGSFSVKGVSAFKSSGVYRSGTEPMSAKPSPRSARYVRQVRSSPMVQYPVFMLLTIIVTPCVQM